MPILPRHKILMLEGQVGTLASENERLRSAIKWALGEGMDADGKGFGEVLPETVPGDLLPRFWWRTQLRRMAGMGGDLSYDKEKRTIVRAARGHG